MFNTTICALSTARMNCAIHIIRLSGPKAFEIINAISNKPIPKEGFRIFYTKLIDENKIVDEVIVNCFVAPHSYTGEDTVEINCHGSVLVADTILNLLVKHGAVFAQRGEFSQRAMMNKKIDICQVEAINNLVNTQNTLSMQAAVNGLVGDTSSKLKEYREQLFKLIGQIEVNIDYPEYHDIEEITTQDTIKTTKFLIKELSNLAINSKRFIPLNEGIKILIIGEPNAGKSTLLNTLTKSDKAIVSDIPGTTRDIVEATINLDNITLKLFDTAGIRQTSDVVENLGIEKAKSYLDKVDLIFLIKAVDTITPNWKDEYEYALNRKHLVVYTKADLLDAKLELGNDEVVISAKTNQIEPLIKKIKQLFEVDEFIHSDMNVLQSNRQIALLDGAIYHLKDVLTKIDIYPLDLIIEDLNLALDNLNKILGLDYEYDFLDELFKNFCLGK